LTSEKIKEQRNIWLKKGNLQAYLSFHRNTSWADHLLSNDVSTTLVNVVEIINDSVDPLSV
jgi:hypothetical protein